ncbi:hypothetical protein BD410DRAFT_425041 [Rickenella mellea]|uniref:SRR1-like domain-containing protein n=1 Tax=Rickenella mellea TaxID=50990 RepID=A0A4Y7QJW1_9AGAM|nr:hypothetical protein BD410DRAFT_425041 [Rickenella mellea]
MSPTDGPFLYDNVSYQPSRSRKKRKKHAPSIEDSAQSRLDRTIAELSSSAWLAACTTLLKQGLSAFGKRPSEILCLGLGSPCASAEARRQLCFLVHLRDVLQICPQNVLACDPIFSDGDVSCLRQCDVVQLTDNKMGKYRLDKPSIAFMPHCTATLYENLLRENWSTACLSNIVVIGNCLAEYVDATPVRKLQTEYPCIARLVPYLVVHVFPAYAPHAATFFNTAVQFAIMENLPAENDSFWDLPEASLVHADDGEIR